MDTTWLVVIAVLVLGSALYILLVALTPVHRAPEPSEKTFLSSTASSPQPLPALTDPAAVDLSVVIPAYNEATRLPSMLDDALNHLQAPSTPKRSVEFIVVDDGSQDKTTAVALELASQYKNTDLRVIRLTKNRGKGGAVQAGVLGSRGRRILMVDADGASRFGDLEQLWDEMSKLEVSPETAVVSIGSRAHLVGTEAVVKRSAVRNFLMHGFHVTLRTLGVGHIRDTQCGFKLFNRPAALALFRPLHLQSWLFDVELLILAQYQNIPVAEVPVGWHEVAGSKLRLISDSIGMLTDLLVLRANYALGRWSIDDGKTA